MFKSNGYTYKELLEVFSVDLFDEAQGRSFSEYALSCELWQWGSVQPFMDQGLVTQKATNDLFLLTSKTEMRGALQYRVYFIGKRLGNALSFALEADNLI